MDGNIDYFLNKNYDHEKNKMEAGSGNIIQDCVVYMKQLYDDLDKDVIKVFVIICRNLLI